MATLTVQNIALTTSLTPSFASADAGGDDFNNNGRTFIYIKNGGGSPITATVNSRVNCSYGFDHDVDITVPAGSEELCGPFNTSRFNNASSIASISYSDVTSVTVAVIALSN